MGDCHSHAACPLCASKTLKPGKVRKVRSVGRRGDRDWVRKMRLMPCHYCGGAGGTIDHIIPRSRGGTNGQHNCVPACKACNEFRGDGDYEDFKAFGWKERRFR